MHMGYFPESLHLYVLHGSSDYMQVSRLVITIGSGQIHVYVWIIKNPSPRVDCSNIPSCWLQSIIDI